MSLRALSPSAVSSIAAALLATGSALAQRGGRQDEFLDRYACYFVEAKLPPADGEVESKARLATVPLVQEAANAGNLSFLYLFDSSAEAPKRAAFDQIVFGNEEVGVALRCFQCARVDIAGDADAQAKFGRQLPLFVAFDEKGKWAGETSLPGYKAALRSLISMLERAASGHVKPTLPDFVKSYRDILRELRVLSGNKRTLEQRRNRADDSKKAQYDQEAKELAAREQTLLAAEKAALEKANVPPRPKDAKMFGRRERNR
jgi:hypothetical protein